MNKGSDSPVLDRVLAEPMLMHEQGFSMKLLSECYSLKEPHRLEPLLRHDDEKVVLGALFVTEEISHRAIPIRPTLLSLLRHPSRSVRYWTMSALHSTAWTFSIDDLARILEAIADDSEESVRFRGLWLLVCYRNPKFQKHDSIDLDALEDLSAYGQLAAHFLSLGTVPNSLVTDPAPTPQEVMLHRKLRLLYDCLDEMRVIEPTDCSGFEDVRNVVQAEIDLAISRAARREAMDAFKRAKDSGNKEAIDAAVVRLREACGVVKKE